MKDSVFEDFLLSNPKNVRVLTKLMKIQIKNRKIVEAISTIDKLIELDPDNTRWLLLKSLLRVYSGAKFRSNEILKKDPLLEKTYYVLLMVASQEDSIEELKKIKKKIEEGIINASLRKNVEDFDELILVWYLICWGLITLDFDLLVSAFLLLVRVGHKN
ncbi:uncharacterized protein [Nicotiana tomentosiformis]|uniref:uncharacterized protein n=1 Tax=Nicotiana tomentosiformis TaxID=4098 RepID=UPI00388CD825